ncbi:MAG: 2-oxoacid ferredoxin oxidoreductase [Deltaproteobacteria bacterium]|nr:2-oxoacid ferredoxin oxidoreductase [Deltaproteobacteria bacterium]MBW2122262.1 2-oxoacid ferredoxin oxidoreductase [Deltaproteobacteria bacterium]
MEIEAFENPSPIAWCPGCGNFAILGAVKQALADMGFKPHEVILVSGIGQAAKLPHYLKCNFFNGLHGRALPAATAIRIANTELPVIVIGGDGDTYGEGGNHFLHGIRRNANLTLITHNNQVFGLTRGQASPTAEKGFVTRVQTHGVFLTPMNPLAVALALEAPFVARGFTGRARHLTDLIKEAVAFEGFSLVDVLQPCVSFDHVHTFQWYKERVYDLEEAGHDPGHIDGAIQKAREWGERIPLGIFYSNPEKPTYEAQSPVLSGGPLVDRHPDPKRVEKLIDSFF